MSNLITIPTSNLPKLDAKLVIINRRVAKFNLPLITYTIESSYEKELSKDKFISYSEIKIDGEIPHINGWQIIASIDHDNGLNIVNSFSPVPHHYRESVAHCDHCNTKRVKRKTVIIKNDDKYMQVGKTCLKEYLATDVTHELRYLEWVDDLVSELKNPDGCYASNGDWSVNVEQVLEVAYLVINDAGFTPASGEFPTRDLVMNVIHPVSKYDREYATTIRDSMNDDSDNAVQLILDYIESQSDGNDFWYNIKKLANQTVVNPKYIGYLVGGVSSYLKYTAKVAEDAASKLNCLNEWVDMPKKKRADFTLTLIRLNMSEGYYGTSYIHTFQDEAGRTFTWFGSKPIAGFKDDGYIRDAVGESFKVKATIKDFTEYKDIKQTVVTRVTVVK